MLQGKKEIDPILLHFFQYTSTLQNCANILAGIAVNHSFIWYILPDKYYMGSHENPWKKIQS